jgi:hypothetical protein
MMDTTMIVDRERSLSLLSCACTTTAKKGCHLDGSSGGGGLLIPHGRGHCRHCSCGRCGPFPPSPLSWRG